jgi:hypothetical protein
VAPLATAPELTTTPPPLSSPERERERESLLSHSKEETAHQCCGIACSHGSTASTLRV